MNEAPAPVVPDPDAADEIERLMLAGALDAAVARLAGVPPESRDDPAIARLRLALHVAGRREVGSDLEADAKLVLPGPDRPPPDLVSLMSGLGAAAPIARAAEAERRIIDAAVKRAMRDVTTVPVETTLDTLRQALASNVPSSLGFLAYGRLLNREQRPTDAAFAFQRAIDFDPADRNAQLELARCLIKVGYSDEAYQALRQGITVPAQQRGLLSNQLLSLVESGAHEDGTLRDAHRQFGTTAPTGIPAFRSGEPNDPPRIGFLWTPTEASGAILIEELLRHRTPGAWRCHVYVQRASFRFKNSTIATGADEWTVAHVLGDRDLARKIADDGTDLLIDLMGHSLHSRLGVMDFRPALAHASWIGYPWPVGHPAVGSIIADPNLCPVGAEARMDTSIARLPLLSCTATTLIERLDAIPSSPEGRPFAFGCFSAPGRIQQEAMDAWASIMAAVPSARLRMVHRDWGMGMARNRLRYTFMRRDVDEKRIDFESPADGTAILAQWRNVDVALDSVPTGDLAATLSALAAGVPIVTVEGDRIAARYAAANLRLLGMERLIAPDLPAYGRMAVRLARDHDTRRRFADEIRRRMPQSALADGPRFARAFETLAFEIIRDAAARGGAR